MELDRGGAGGKAEQPPARLPAPLSRRVLELAPAAGDTPGLPRRVQVTTWGAPLALARCTLVYAGGALTSSEEIPLHSANAGGDIYAQRGIHVIAIDKTGTGGTELNPLFQIRRDYPRLLTRVTEELGVSRYAILGISNGGPYVMAALTAPAKADRSRVLGAAMCVGVSDVSASGYFGLGHPSGLAEGLINSLPIAVGGAAIWLGLKLGTWALFGPMRLYARCAPPSLATSEAAAIVRRMLDDGCASSGRGLALDSQQGLSPLHARPRTDVPGGESSAETAYRAIRVPVALWYGRRDWTVPLRTADWLAERIPGSTKHYVPDAGHGLFFEHAPALLDDLAAKVAGAQSGQSGAPPAGGPATFAES